MLEPESVATGVVWTVATTGRSNASTYGTAPASRVAAVAARSNQSGADATTLAAAGRSNASTYGVGVLLATAFAAARSNQSEGGSATAFGTPTVRAAIAIASESLAFIGLLLVSDRFVRSLYEEGRRSRLREGVKTGKAADERPSVAGVG